MSDLVHHKTDHKLFNGLLIMLGVSCLFPEYIAPFFVFGLYIMFLVHFKKTGRNAKIGTLGKSYMAYMLYMVFSAIWSDTHLLSAAMGFLWMGCFLAYIEVANIVNTKDKLKDAITAVNVSSGIIGGIGVLEFLTYNLEKYTNWKLVVPNPLYYDFNEFIYNLFSFDIVNNVYPSRANSTFDNPLICATFLIVTIPFCAFGSIYFKHSKNRKISRVCFISSLAGLICTESRGAYIAIGLSVLTMLISNKKIFKKLIPFVFALAIAIPITLVIRNINSPIGDLLGSRNQRMLIWQACINIFKDNWLVGLGAGTENIHKILIEVLGVDRAHCHNLFLQVLVEGGVIGGLFVTVIIGVIIKNMISLFVLKDGLYRPYAILYTSSIVGFIMISLFEYTLQSPKEMMIFFILLGFIEATRRMATNEIQLADDEQITYEEINEADYVTDKEEQKITK